MTLWNTTKFVMCAKELTNLQHEFGKINGYFPRRTLHEMGVELH
jgi:hypothetical protein